MPTEIFHQKFEVPYHYPVVFTQDVFGSNEQILRLLIKQPKARIFCVIDEGVFTHWPQLKTLIPLHFKQIQRDLVGELHIVPGGETCKNDPQHLKVLLQKLEEVGLDRQSYLMAMGGGAVLDLCGLAASLCHRGVRLLRFPTTVLSQNDSGVGVKNGINLWGQKNYLGTFAPPFAVINDFNFLKTLAAKDIRAGFSEAIKVALIKDVEFFRWLESHRTQLNQLQSDAVETLILRCAELHMNHISGGGDPFEQGNHRPLDFGHWSAHRLEGLSHNQLSHGEAVALGMRLDLHLSHQLTELPKPSLDRALGLIESLGLPTWSPHLLEQNEQAEWLIYQGLEEFRQHLGGELNVTLITEIGHQKAVHEISQQQVLNAIQNMIPLERSDETRPPSPQLL